MDIPRPFASGFVPMEPGEVTAQLFSEEEKLL